MSSLTLLLRVGIAMAVVVALMWVAARLLARRAGGSPGRSTPAEIELVARRGLSKGSSVAVVRTGGRTLILGVTDAQISLLAEADPSAIDLADEASGMLAPGGSDPRPARMQFLDSLRERTVRR